MKNVMLLIAATFLCLSSSAEYIEGYCKSNGVCVQGYYRNERNSTSSDNYPASRNVTPYTGLSVHRTNDYNSGSVQLIQTGPRGGQYYVDENGKKIYVPKQ